MQQLVPNKKRRENEKNVNVTREERWGTCMKGRGTCMEGWGTCMEVRGTCMKGWGTCMKGCETWYRKFEVVDYELKWDLKNGRDTFSPIFSFV